MSTAVAAAPGPTLASLQRWGTRTRATSMLFRTAAIVDVETTDLNGRICEIAIIDAHGRTLLDTLVNPEAPITAAAEAVHGLNDEDVRNAPTWAQLAESVSWMLRDRPVLAYNAPFDQGVITREMRRAGHTSWSSQPWWCLMRARSRVEERPWRALEGGHRALGDCRAALEVLETISWLPAKAPLLP